MTSTRIKSKPYNNSERLALSNGFMEVEEATAYNNRYFIKDNKIWIHNIEALKRRLNIKSDEKLLEEGYDVATYHEIHSNKLFFNNAYDAQEYAKRNIGVIITRSSCGNGYIVK